MVNGQDMEIGQTALPLVGKILGQGVNFINISRTNFSYERRFLPTCNYRKAAKTTFHMKNGRV